MSEKGKGPHYDTTIHIIGEDECRRLIAVNATEREVQRIAENLKLAQYVRIQHPDILLEWQMKDVSCSINV